MRSVHTSQSLTKNSLLIRRFELVNLLPVRLRLKLEELRVRLSAIRSHSRSSSFSKRKRRFDLACSKVRLYSVFSGRHSRKNAQILSVLYWTKKNKDCLISSFCSATQLVGLSWYQKRKNNKINRKLKITDLC